MVILLLLLGIEMVQQFMMYQTHIIWFKLHIMTHILDLGMDLMDAGVHIHFYLQEILYLLILIVIIIIMQDYLFMKEIFPEHALEGNVTDGNTGANLVGASIEILNTFIPNSSSTTLNGNYSCGNADAGLFDVKYSMPGYISDTLSVNLINGQTVIQDAQLFTDPSIPILGCMDSLASNYNPNANISVEFGGEADNTFSTGGYFNGNQHLIFDAYNEFVIKSAVFYADDNNTVTFELRNSMELY